MYFADPLSVSRKCVELLKRELKDKGHGCKNITIIIKAY